MQGVEANADASSISANRSCGCDPAAMVPLTEICRPSGEVVTWMSVGPSAATVLTVEVTWNVLTSGRHEKSAASPGLVGVVSRSMRLSLMISGVGVGSSSPIAEKARSSITTSPATRVMPAARTCAAMESSPARGSSGVSVAPGRSFAYAWSTSV